MLRKNLNLLCLLCFIQGTGSAQNFFTDTYKPGDRLYVYSKDGLSLREQADPKGTLILVAGYGEELIVLADDKPRVSFTSSNISGAWVKVKHKDRTGFMFNGFLSRLRPMPVTSPDQELDAYKVYLKSQFKLLKETRTPPEAIFTEYDKMDFANEVSYEHKIYEGGASIITRFPVKAFTYQEVFLLARIAYPEFFGEKKCEYKVDHMECELNELTSLEIKKDGNFFVVISGVAD
jgi:hypothetical protein